MQIDDLYFFLTNRNFSDRLKLGRGLLLCAVCYVATVCGHIEDLAQLLLYPVPALDVLC